MRVDLKVSLRVGLRVDLSVGLRVGLRVGFYQAHGNEEKQSTCWNFFFIFPFEAERVRQKLVFKINVKLPTYSCRPFTEGYVKEEGTMKVGFYIMVLATVKSFCFFHSIGLFLKLEKKGLFY